MFVHLHLFKIKDSVIQLIVKIFLNLNLKWSFEHYQFNNKINIMFLLIIINNYILSIFFIQNVHNYSLIFKLKLMFCVFCVSEWPCTQGCWLAPRCWERSDCSSHMISWSWSQWFSFSFFWKLGEPLTIQVA